MIHITLNELDWERLNNGSPLSVVTEVGTIVLQRN